MKFSKVLLLSILVTSGSYFSAIYSLDRSKSDVLRDFGVTEESLNLASSGRGLPALALDYIGQLLGMVKEFGNKNPVVENLFVKLQATIYLSFKQQNDVKDDEIDRDLDYYYSSLGRTLVRLRSINSAQQFDETDDRRSETQNGVAEDLSEMSMYIQQVFRNQD
jgi:hypothetical protein